ncbi:hypothetical protein EYF80_048432 [Liparis tanakae]|uniref:Uncharacterized protein n=1 Tax=Liparis tanakae TaxID=230148 RepID=A0A4Z2FKB0_9TELE|nr:hypothetical protein EYF80_048432 [Liparis tanakae]
MAPNEDKKRPATPSPRGGRLQDDEKRRIDREHKHVFPDNDPSLGDERREERVIRLLCGARESGRSDKDPGGGLLCLYMCTVGSLPANGTPLLITIDNADISHRSFNDHEANLVQTELRKDPTQHFPPPELIYCKFVVQPDSSRKDLQYLSSDTGDDSGLSCMGSRKVKENCMCSPSFVYSLSIITTV